MDFNFTPDQIAFRKMAQDLVAKEITPYIREMDEKGEMRPGLIQKFHEAGILNLVVPEEYDGPGLDALSIALIYEELGKGCAGIATSAAANALASYPVVVAGTEEQKRKMFDTINDGKLAAFALTEPNAGSDAGSIRTTAVKKGDKYVLNGTKQWITNGGEADIYTVFAVTDKNRGARGVSCFIVEKGTPGFTFGKKENKMGIRASATRELIFEDCEVPAENLIGREGTGFIWAMKTFDVSRPGIAAQAVGLAQGALDEAVSYAKVREQFGRPIIANQGLSWMLAEMATKVEAARALTYATVRTIDSGAKDYSKFSAMCKLFASDIAMQVTTDAVQVLGGYGYMREYPAEKMMRDAKILQIYEGTNQIQRDIIGLALNKEYAAAAKG